MTKYKIIIVNYEKNKIDIFDYPYGTDHSQAKEFYNNRILEGLVDSNTPFEECDYSIMEAGVEILIH